MFSSRTRRGYQVIDDEYDDSVARGAGASMFQQPTMERNRLFRGEESDPLVPSMVGAYSQPPTSHNATPGEEGPTIRGPPRMATSETGEARWDHIANLDDFFSRVYEYHQGGGYLCISIRKILGLIQFIFIVDVVVDSCASHLNPLIVISILFAIAFWISRVVKTAHCLLHMHEVQRFYTGALGINDHELVNLTWHEVVKRICEVQPKVHLMINSDNLTPADVYNRILRFKNYLVALVNLRLLPPVLDVPFLGEMAYLPNGLKSNIKHCIFSGSTWEGPYLKEDYKNVDNLEILTRQMENHVKWYGMLNLILIPFILLYQVLFAFFSIAEMIKKSPDTLGMRRYSNYGRYRVRHFNELTHELDARLNRSHVYANAYMNQFYSPVFKVVATHIRFMVGAVALTLTGLTMWDEDVIQIEHLLTVIAVCGGLFVLCNSFIPEENLVWQPEALLTHVTSELHYTPSEWKHIAHTEKVRREFEELFQLKWMFLLHELSSPIITPFVLLFWLRPRCGDVVRFFHENTVTVQGLGDVCSFALMDVGRHGDPKWNNAGQTSQEMSTSHRALDGKTELSVLHFAATNPDWKPPRSSAAFIERFRNRMEQDASRLSVVGGANLLMESVQSLLPPPMSALSGKNTLIGDGLHRIDGPVEARVGGGLYGVAGQRPDDSMTNSLRHSGLDVDAPGADMRVQALFLRGLHDDSIKQSMATSTSGYGGSIAPHNMQSVFGVPQLAHDENNGFGSDSLWSEGGRSRLVLRPTQMAVVDETHLERPTEEAEEEERDRQEDDDDDELPPTTFMGI